MSFFHYTNLTKEIFNYIIAEVTLPLHNITRHEIGMQTSLSIFACAFTFHAAC